MARKGHSVLEEADVGRCAKLFYVSGHSVQESKQKSSYRDVGVHSGLMMKEEMRDLLRPRTPCHG